MPSLVRLSVACYRLLLAAYPPAYRQTYGGLMLQLFRDLCRDAYEQSGLTGLLRLWARTLFDLVISAEAAYVEAVKEAVMMVDHRITSASWWQVALVLAPGLLYGLAPRSGVIWWWLTIGSVAGVTILAVAALASQKGLPSWSLLVLGILTHYAVLRIGFLARAWGGRWSLNYETVSLLMAIPLWTVIILLTWKYRLAARLPSWTLALLALLLIGALAFVGFSALSTAGVILLPFALGLPMSQRHGSLAVLFIIGAYSVIFLDSDHYSGPLLWEMRFYRPYVLLLKWLFMGVAPLLLLRARSQPGRAAGLLAPVAIALLLSVAVPWLLRPAFHPLRIWLGNALGALFILSLLALAFVAYRGGGDEEIVSPQRMGSALLIS